jgi:plasmid stability protein
MTALTALTALSRTRDYGVMATITIRNLSDSAKTKLRVRAAENGRSMEEEARQILKAAVMEPSVEANEAEKTGNGTEQADVAD